MKLIDFLLRRKTPPVERNITDRWIADPELTLSVNVGTYSLCGVKLGEPFEKLHGLGPSAQVEYNQRTGGSGYLYSQYGFSFAELNGLFCALFISVTKIRPFKSYQGEWWFHDIPLHLSPKTTFDEIESILGKPSNSYDDAGEIAYFYEHGAFEVEFLGGRRGLSYVTIEWYEHLERSPT